MKTSKKFKLAVACLVASFLIGASSTAWGLSLSRVYTDIDQIVQVHGDAALFGLIPGDGPEAGEGSGVDFYPDNHTKTLVNASVSYWVPVVRVDKWYTTAWAWDNILWSDFYLLEGDPGESATISLDYDLYYNSCNVAGLGFQYNKTAVHLNWWTDSWDDIQHFHEYYEYELIHPGMKFPEGHITGTLTLGSFSVGEYLRFGAVHEAYSSAKALGSPIPPLGGAGFMVSTFDYTMYIDGIPQPVPESTTIFLLGTGLLGLAGLGRRRFLKK